MTNVTNLSDLIIKILEENRIEINVNNNNIEVLYPNGKKTIHSLPHNNSKILNVKNKLR